MLKLNSSRLQFLCSFYTLLHGYGQLNICGEDFRSLENQGCTMGCSKCIVRNITIILWKGLISTSSKYASYGRDWVSGGVIDDGWHTTTVENLLLFGKSFIKLGNKVMG